MGIGERIRSARKRAGISQTALAKLVGRSQSAVAEWETGETEPRRNIVEAIAAALGVSATWLEIGGAEDPHRAYEDTAPSPSARSKHQTHQHDMGPVFAAELMSNGEHLLKTKEIVEYRLKPNKWADIKNLFGFYVMTDAMSPRINPGELIWAHPRRQAAPGQEAVFIRREKEANQSVATVNILVGQTATKWIVKQLNPKREFDLKKADWQCQLVVDIELNR